MFDPNEYIADEYLEEMKVNEQGRKETRETANQEKYCFNCNLWEQTTFDGMIYGYCQHEDSLSIDPDNVRFPFLITPKHKKCSEWKKKTTTK